MLDSVSEVNHESSRELEVVLGLLEKRSAHVICLQSPGKSRIEAVIRTSAQLHRKRDTATRYSLRLFVGTADQRVDPRFPPSLPPGNFWPTAINEQLDMLFLKDFWGVRC